MPDNTEALDLPVQGDTQAAVEAMERLMAAMTRLADATEKSKEKADAASSSWSGFLANASHLATAAQGAVDFAQGLHRVAESMAEASAEAETINGFVERTGLSLDEAADAAGKFVSQQTLVAESSRLVEAGFQLSQQQFDAFAHTAAVFAQRTGQDIPTAMHTLERALVGGGARAMQQFGLAARDASGHLLTGQARIDELVEHASHLPAVADNAADAMARLQEQTHEAFRTVSVNAVDSFTRINDLNASLRTADGAAHDAGITLGQVGQFIGRVGAAALSAGRAVVDGLRLMFSAFGDYVHSGAAALSQLFDDLTHGRFAGIGERFAAQFDVSARTAALSNAADADVTGVVNAFTAALPDANEHVIDSDNQTGGGSGRFTGQNRPNNAAAQAAHRRAREAAAQQRRLLQLMEHADAVPHLSLQGGRDYDANPNAPGGHLDPLEQARAQLDALAALKDRMGDVEANLRNEEQATHDRRLEMIQSEASAQSALIASARDAQRSGLALTASQTDALAHQVETAHQLVRAHDMLTESIRREHQAASQSGDPIERDRHEQNEQRLRQQQAQNEESQRTLHAHTDTGEAEARRVQGQKELTSAFEESSKAMAQNAASALVHGQLTAQGLKAALHAQLETLAIKGIVKAAEWTAQGVSDLAGVVTAELAPGDFAAAAEWAGVAALAGGGAAATASSSKGAGAGATSAGSSRTAPSATAGVGGYKSDGGGSASHSFTINVNGLVVGTSAEVGDQIGMHLANAYRENGTTLHSGLLSGGDS